MHTMNLPQGGHGPEHLRSAFADLALAPDGETTIIDGRARSLAWVAGKLWSCPDVMPRALCDYLDLPAGSSFAVGARLVRRRLGGAAS